MPLVGSMRCDRSKFLVALATALIGLAPETASASDLAWTNCHTLAIGGKQYTECQRCAAKGLGWRFYMSRDGSLIECRRDPQARTSPTRTPEFSKREPVRQFTPPTQRAVTPTPPSQRTVIPAQVAAPPKIHTLPKPEHVAKPAPTTKPATTPERPHASSPAKYHSRRDEPRAKRAE